VEIESGVTVSDKLAYYTTREAAERLGISVRTAQLWVEGGILNAWKTAGGHRRIAVESVTRLERATEPAAAVAAVDTLPAQKPLKVAVVEDDPIFLRLYEAMIGKWPFPVELKTAEDGYRGLLLIGRFLPDMVITDLNMPGIDGFRLLRAILTDWSLRQTRVVAVTALDEEAWAKYGGMPDGVTVFRKPIPFPKLEEIARAILAQRPSHAAVGGHATA
jgi:excisionase family DNA binding protein